MADPEPIPTILVTGASAGARETRIAKAIADQPAALVAVLMEGVPDGRAPLENRSGLQIARVASGCLCCTGNLVMKVTLNRLLRQRPTRMFIGIASTDHLPRVKQLLSSAPYSTLIRLESDLSA